MTALWDIYAGSDCRLTTGTCSTNAIPYCCVEDHSPTGSTNYGPNERCTFTPEVPLRASLDYYNVVNNYYDALIIG